MRRARAQWYAVKSELEHELAAEELQRSLRETRDAVQRTDRELRAEGDALQRDIDDALRGSGASAPIVDGDDSAPDASRAADGQERHER